MTMTGGELTETEYTRFCKLIYKVAGIRIQGSKRLMVTTRVRRRLRATGIATFSAYLTFLESPAGTSEMPLFVDEMTTNETYFYRDPHHFEWFGKEYLPEIIQQAALRKRPKSLRIWSAASSSGEELYSIALKVVAAKSQLAGWNLSLLGTDLNGTILEAARNAVYDDRAVRLVSQEERQLHFSHDPASQKWSLNRDVKAYATFKPHNLLEPLKEMPFDCIFIKNVLIYFDEESKKMVIRHLLAALAKGGYLVVGPSEGIQGMLGALTKHKLWLYQKPV